MKKILNFMFSRYALSLVFILAELAILIYFLFYGYTYSTLLVILTGIIDVLVIVSLINRDTNPEFKLTWLAVVTTLPVIGGALYIIFSHRRLSRRESRLLSGIANGLLENKKKSLLMTLARLKILTRYQAFPTLAEDERFRYSRTTDSPLFTRGARLIITIAEKPFSRLSLRE